MKGVKEYQSHGTVRLGSKANSAQLKFRCGFDDHDLVTFEKMHGHLRDTTTTHNQFNSSVRDGFNLLFHSVLFGLVVRFQFFGFLDEHGTLGVGLSNFEA